MKLGGQTRKRWLIERQLKAAASWCAGDRVPVYYFDGVSNFGDQIGPFIASAKTGRSVYNVRHLPWTPKRAYCTAGSLLHSLSKDNCSVWGSGFICAPPAGKPKARPYEVRALRGPISARIAEDLGWGSCSNLGDPGLILPDFLPAGPVAKRRKIAVIPHYAFAQRRDLGEIADYLVFPWQKLEHVVQEIASSELVVSSSLHGIILAEAYRVPWVWWREPHDPRAGGEMKFLDFFGSIDVANPPSIAGAFFEERNWLGTVEKIARAGSSSVLATRQNQLRASMPAFEDAACNS